MLIRLVVAGLLIAHAAIHVAYLSPRPPVTAGGPAWPFDLGQSWLLPRLGVEPHRARGLAIALISVLVIGFAIAAGVAFGVLPTALWGPALAIGSTASLLLLLTFFHPWLIVGVAIDIALLAVALLGPWTPTAT